MKNLSLILVISLLNISTADAASKRLKGFTNSPVCSPACGSGQTCCETPADGPDDFPECIDNQNLSDSCCPPLGNAADC